MALVVKTTTPSFTQDTRTAGFAPPVTAVAGETLAALDAVYMNTSGEFIKADGTAATAPAAFKGIVVDDYVAGDPCSAYGPDVILRYADGTLTPGATLYVAATAGRLDTAATTGDALGVAWAISDSEIQITRRGL